MSTTAIREAFFTLVQAFPYSPTPEIVYPGKQVAPPDAGLWLRPNIFPNETNDEVWGDDGCVQVRGFAQVLVYFRPGMGTIEPSELADALIAYFSKGTVMGPVRVFKKPWQSSVVTQDSSQLFIPVTIPYRGTSSD